MSNLMTICDRYHKTLERANPHHHKRLCRASNYEERTRQLQRPWGHRDHKPHFFYDETPKNCANVVTLSDSYVFRPVLNGQSQSRPSGRASEACTSSE
jgi:hypothetical protein